MRIPFLSHVPCPGSSRRGHEVTPTTRTSHAQSFAAEAPPALAPVSFVLGPGPYTSLPPQELRSLLAAGERFEPGVDARITAVCGQRLTPEGLATVFARLWPAATWTVSAARCAAQGVVFEVSALDRRGHLLYHNVASAWRWSDDALEFHMQTPHVQRDARRLGLHASCETLGQDILRALCRHPDARCTLAVSPQAYDATTGQVDFNASFDAARRGYMFADTFGMQNPASESVSNGKAAFTSTFSQWLAQEPTLNVRGTPLTDEDRTQLLAQARASYQPKEFLRIGLPGATASGRGEDGCLQPMPVGEAFLRNTALPPWCAVRFVNSLGPRGDGRVGQLRAQSQVCCGMSLKRDLADAQARIHTWRQSVWEDLGATEPERRAEAYQAVGMYAPPGMRHALRDRMPRKHLVALRPSQRFVELEPSARAALQQALDLMDGQGSLASASG